MQSDWLKKRCRKLVSNNALLKTMWCVEHLVPMCEGDQTLGGVSQPGYVLIQLSVAQAVSPEDPLITNKVKRDYK